MEISETIEKLKNSYCNFCDNQQTNITVTFKIECRNCGKTRIITRKIR